MELDSPITSAVFINMLGSSCVICFLVASGEGGSGGQWSSMHVGAESLRKEGHRVLNGTYSSLSH